MRPSFAASMRWVPVAAQRPARWSGCAASSAPRGWPVRQACGAQPRSCRDSSLWVPVRWWALGGAGGGCMGRPRPRSSCGETFHSGKYCAGFLSRPLRLTAPGAICARPCPGALPLVPMNQQRPHVEPASSSLAGRVAIVTGAGSRSSEIGNGRAAAILLARRGAQVLLLDARLDAARETERMIADEGGSAICAQIDVAEAEPCRQAVAIAVQAWGRVDILVNNVGIGGPAGNAVDLDIAQWERALRVNVTSMMLMARYAIPEMRKLGAGAIVNIASIAGLIGGTPALLYPTSKG